MWGELLGLALVAGILFWLLRGRTAGATSSKEATGDLSYEEMEAADELRQAEDEVRERGTNAQPEDEEPGDDWGPGTSRSY
jgi:hypothetical protein